VDIVGSGSCHNLDRPSRLLLLFGGPPHARACQKGGPTPGFPASRKTMFPAPGPPGLQDPESGLPVDLDTLLESSGGLSMRRCAGKQCAVFFNTMFPGPGPPGMQDPESGRPVDLDTLLEGTGVSDETSSGMFSDLVGGNALYPEDPAKPPFPPRAGRVSAIMSLLKLNYGADRPSQDRSREILRVPVWGVRGSISPLFCWVTNSPLTIVVPRQIFHLYVSTQHTPTVPHNPHSPSNRIPRGTLQGNHTSQRPSTQAVHLQPMPALRGSQLFRGAPVGFSVQPTWGVRGSLPLLFWWVTILPPCRILPRPTFH